MRHAGQVLTHQLLVDRVWGLEAADIGDESSVVKGHIRNLRRKLGEDGEQPGYIRTVAGVGYSFCAPGVGRAAGSAGEQATPMGAGGGR
jgi:DNA-binding response OmpR family regulator